MTHCQPIVKNKIIIIEVHVHIFNNYASNTNRYILEDEQQQGQHVK